MREDPSPAGGRGQGEGGSNSRKARPGGANHPHPNPLPGGEGDTGRLSSYAIPLGVRASSIGSPRVLCHPGARTTPGLAMDTFSRDNLPPSDQWPVFLLDRPEFQYPARLNCVAELVDRALDRGWADRPAFRTQAEHWTYAQVADKTARIAEILTNRHSLRP